jgi:hypothetical protein
MLSGAPDLTFDFRLEIGDPSIKKGHAWMAVFPPERSMNRKRADDRRRSWRFSFFSFNLDCFHGCSIQDIKFQADTSWKCGTKK